MVFDAVVFSDAAAALRSGGAAKSGGGCVGSGRGTAIGIDSGGCEGTSSSRSDTLPDVGEPRLATMEDVLSIFNPLRTRRDGFIPQVSADVTAVSLLIYASALMRAAVSPLRLR